MSMRTGLRTEIILSITLLMAAAILFVGFLQIKLTEQNLLEQQNDHAAGLIRLTVASLEAPLQQAAESDPARASLGRLQTLLGQQAGISGWRLLDTRLEVLASTLYDTSSEFSTLPPAAMARDELFSQLVYDSFHFFSSAPETNYLDLSMPLWDASEAYALLQIRFNLDDLHARVQRSQQLVIVYALVYGLVLAVFGVYLLNRNVVRPVRHLQQATAVVAGGTLTPVKVPAGPGEIQELAASFNRMIDALIASRAETDRHIDSLEQANHALAHARDDLVRSEKLATVGHLAAGMAHEIGNPLGAVIGYLNLLRQDLDGESRDLVERSLVETGRIDRLVRELLDYAAPGEHEGDVFSVVELLRETVTLLRHQGQLEGVEIEDRCVDDGKVRMDRGRLMQVWINLLLNALDAVPAGGKVELVSSRGSDAISLTVRDNGPGMSPAVITRIFEPFFTTKAPGSGYGLGLAVCQRIIDESGGSLKVDSQPGRGSVFTVTLPLATENG